MAAAIDWIGLQTYTHTAPTYPTKEIAINTSIDSPYVNIMNKLIKFTWCALGISSLSAAAILYFYYSNSGGISSDRNDWAAFGSLISGVFTLLSALATIATLLFMQKQQLDSAEQSRSQQQKHDEIVTHQISALTFDQYQKHRSIFMERLKEKENLFKNEIHFQNLDKIYSKIFPNNSPTFCEYKIIIQSQQSTAGNLHDCKCLHKNLENQLVSHSIDAKNLITTLLRTQRHLGYHYSGKCRNGDIFLDGNNTGINIFRLNHSIAIIEDVLNSILFYSGNTELKTIHHLASTPNIRDTLYTSVTMDKRLNSHFCISFSEKPIETLFNIHLILEQIFSSSCDLMINSFRMTEEIFSDYQNIEKIDICEAINSIFQEYEKISAEEHKKQELFWKNLKPLLIEAQLQMLYPTTH